ncbi:unnamed protein product [[Candida] boidinii]|uniref:Unnamed protein product n=1 Tax=Candida boidinii TaxID=5477 RepID=A0A9W6WGG4_CANBO|nr:unnamed protein product [[Candida] boidinii]
MSSFDTNITVSNQSHAYSNTLSNTRVNKIVNNDIDLNSTPKTSEQTDMLVESLNNLILQPSSNNNEYTHDPEHVQKINNNSKQSFKNDINSGSGITNKNLSKPSVNSESINKYMTNVDKDKNNSLPLNNAPSEIKGLDDNFGHNQLNVEIISTNSDEHNYSNNNKNHLTQTSSSNDSSNDNNSDSSNSKKIDLMKRIDADDGEYEQSIITNEDLNTPRLDLHLENLQILR